MRYSYYQAGGIGLLKKFIQCSNSDKVIVRVCSIIESIKHNLRYSDELNEDIEARKIFKFVERALNR